MWWDGEPLDLYIGPGHVGALQAGRLLSWHPWPDPLERLPSLLAEVAGGRARWSRRRRLRAWLSGAFARPILLPAIAGLNGWHEAEAAARAAAQTQWGWAQCVAWLQDFPARQPALAVAVQSAVISKLHDAARGSGLRLTSIRPWWALATAQVHNAGEPQCCAIEDADSLVFLAAAGPAWIEAAAYAPRPSPDQARAILQRRAVAVLPGGAVPVQRFGSAMVDGVLAPRRLQGVAAEASERR
ncbi:MAG: hypothetical protein JNM97_23435 [Rhodoferax sp.]|nr:hypothetical protein [Rhodoferax sp.]